MSTLPHSLKERVLGAVRAAPTLTRRQWLLRQGALLALALTILVGLSFAHGLTPMRERPALHLWVSVIGFVGLGIASTQALAVFAFAPLGPSRTRLRWRKRAAAPALALIAVLANLAAPETLVGPAPGFHFHVMCPLLLLGSGTIVAALAIFGMRGADPLGPRDTAAALGACAGVWAALAVSLQCHFTDPFHVLATHVLPVSLLAAGAARWGARAVSVTGLALALVAISPGAASAFVGAPVGGQPGQVDVTARAEFERGSVEPNENELSWQDAEWEVYSAGVGYTGAELFGLERPFLRLEYATYTAPAEVNQRGPVAAEHCRGRVLDATHCEFHPADTGHFVKVQLGFDLIHRPTHALSLFLQGTLPIGANTDRFVLPRIDLVALGLAAGMRFQPWLTFQSRIYLGSGSLDGKQNATVALVPLFGFEAERWILPWKIGLQVGPYFDADLTERYDANYDGAYVSGVPTTNDGSVRSPGDTRDRIRMMRFGVSVLPYVQVTPYLVVEGGYTQKLFGYDTPATRFFSVGLRGAFSRANR